MGHPIPTEDVLAARRIKHAADVRRWNAANPERLAACSARYYAKNKEACKARAAKNRLMAVYVCPQCATHVGPDKDLCRAHAIAWGAQQVIA